MPEAPLDPGYAVTAVAVVVAITVTLRALPFAVRGALSGSALLADLGRWMPLGAVAILAAYCLSGVDLTAGSHGLDELVGVAVTVAVHRWRRNALLSIATGTAAYLLLVNVGLPT
ncbi:branched-chain amino acid transporter permease [Kineococcus glutinatus]|uniref:AzlD domain-containing protein n=1 Tax=Kineococcus glutinatus TaxID=1070872 RepID=A0ABP9H9I2_9ACTN